MHFPQAVFWFEATFVSDQKEQDLLHGGDRPAPRPAGAAPGGLLDRTHLAERALDAAGRGAAPGPDRRPTRSPATAWSARSRRLANTHHRELTERLDRQLERIGRYYADLRAEVEEQAGRRQGRDEDPAKFAARIEGLDREEQLRAGELRQKSQLKVHLRLLNLLVIHQPKLLLQTAVVASSSGPTAGRLEWVYDPLVEAVEAAVCPECRHPTFEFAVTRQGRLVCPACASAAMRRRARPALIVRRSGFETYRPAAAGAGS